MSRATPDTLDAATTGAELRSPGEIPGPPQRPSNDPEPNYLNAERGLWSWLTTVDHKRIGVLYTISILSMFFLGGMFAILLRLELLTPGPTIMSADSYNKAFMLHGAIMTFLVLVPSIPAMLGNFVMPLMLGAKDVAFPRMNLASWYFYILGATVMMASLIYGGIDTGWTLYAPYSTETSGGVGLVLVGAFILGFSSIFTGLNFIATIHKLRAPGMDWFKMPLFVWGHIRDQSDSGVGNAGAGHYAAAAADGKTPRRRRFRPGVGRRPGVIPALLLVLFTPGRLHHDPAGDGDHERGHPGLLPQDDFRL